MKDMLNQVAVSLTTPSAQSAQAAAPVVRPSTVGQVDAASGKDLPTDVGAERKKVDLEQVNQAVSDLNDYVQTVGRELQFSVDADSGRTIIKVLDSQTQDLIRQIPADEAIALAEHLKQAEKLDSTGLEVKA